MTPEGSAEIDRDDVRVGDAYERARGDERHERRRAEALPAGSPRRSPGAGVREPGHDSLDPRGGLADRTHRRSPIGSQPRSPPSTRWCPAAGELAAMLFVEVADPADLAAAATQLEGVERAVFIEVAGTRVRGVPEVVSPPGEIAPAHYLRFNLEPDQRAAVLGGSAIAAGTEHPQSHRDRRARRGPAAGDRRGPLTPGSTSARVGPAAQRDLLVHRRGHRRGPLPRVAGGSIDARVAHPGGADRFG